MVFETLQIRNEKKRQRKSNLVGLVKLTAVGLGLFALLGLGVSGCKHVRKLNTEDADNIAASYGERLDTARDFLTLGDTVNARYTAIRTLNDIRVSEDEADVNYGGNYSQDLKDLKGDLSEIASYK